MTQQHVDRHAPGPVDRACTLLELIAASGGELGFAEISARSGLAPATTHRMLRTLTSRGFLRQLPSRRYELGAMLFRLGSAASHRVHGWAQPALSKVVGELGESAYFACLDGDQVRYLDRAESSQAMRSRTEIGTRTLTHSSAIGKALLLQLSPAQRSRVLDASGLPAYTEHTTIDPHTLAAELATAATVGFTVDNQEHELGASGIAVPAPVDGSVWALGITGPWNRFRTADPAHVARVLHSAAATLDDPQ